MMRPFAQQFGINLARIAEFTVGFTAILMAYLLFLLVFENAKFLELVILFFEIKQ